MHRFSWINEWTERADGHGHAGGIELIVPDWFYRAVLDDALVLTIDRAYFDLTGGMERWLYRLVRKHGGHQRAGWRFDFRHLHAQVRPACRRSSASRSNCATSSAASRCRDTASSSRSKAAGASCSPSSRPGYPQPLWTSCGTARAIRNRGHVLSGTGHSCYQEPKTVVFISKFKEFRRA